MFYTVLHIHVPHIHVLHCSTHTCSTHTCSTLFYTYMFHTYMFYTVLHIHVLHCSTHTCSTHTCSTLFYTYMFHTYMFYTTAKNMTVCYLPPLFKKESGINVCNICTCVLACVTSSLRISISIVLANALDSANLVLKSNISICGVSGFWSDSTSLLLKSLMVSYNLKEKEKGVCIRKNMKIINLLFSASYKN